MKKTKNLLILLFTFTAFILEFIPGGVVMFFANPYGEPWRSEYPFFSLLPYGYAVVGPLMTGILTAVILLLSLLILHKYTKGLNTAVMVISAAAAVLSIQPIMFGIKNFTVIGGIITLLHICVFFCCIKKHG